MSNELSGMMRPPDRRALDEFWALSALGIIKALGERPNPTYDRYVDFAIERGWLTRDPLALTEEGERLLAEQEARYSDWKD